MDYRLAISNPAWMAGFFDGEGCVSIRKSFDSRRSLAGLNLLISVAQKDTIILGLIVSCYGGNLHRCAGCHEVRWHGKYAKKFIETILPYSAVKRTQLEIALEFISTYQEGRFDSVPLGTVRKRYALLEDLKAQRGRLN